MSEGWRATSLGDVIDLKRGYDLPEQRRRPGAVPVVSSSGVSGSHDEAKVKAPGVVTGRYGTIGEVFYVEEDFWPLNTTLYVRDFKGNDPRFVSYFLRSVDYFAYSDKAAVPGVNRNHLHQAEVLWPPADEQRQVASVLGALDDKIDLNRRLNETLEALARVVFKSWFVDFDPVRAKAEGRAPAAMDPATAALLPHEFEHSELGRIPKGWALSSVGNLVELQRGTTYKSRMKGSHGPYLLGLASIQRNGGFRADKLVRYGGDSPSRLLLSAGDLYVSLKDVTQSADLLGAVARVPRFVDQGRLTQDTVKLELRGNTVTANLLYRSLLTPAYREYCRAHATGTTNLGLSREDFLGYPIILPDAAVLEAFNAFVDSLEQRSEAAAEESITLEQLRDALLPKLLSGELRVRDADRIVERAV